MHTWMCTPTTINTPAGKSQAPCGWQVVFFPSFVQARALPLCGSSLGLYVPSHLTFNGRRARPKLLLTTRDAVDFLKMDYNETMWMKDE